MPKVLIQLKANPKQTKEVSERDGNILVKLGRWEYQTTALEGGPPPRVPRSRPRKVLAETLKDGPFNVSAAAAAELTEPTE